MNSVVQELDEKLKALSPDKAASVERLLRSAIDLMDGSKGSDSALSMAAHGDHIDRILGEAAQMDWSDFERPTQGQLEDREDW